MRGLEIRGLSVRYRDGHRDFLAVNSVDLDAECGSVLGIVGESGSGKSSLARALVGLAPISSGRVSLNGRDITTARARRRHRVRVQMIFQDPFASLDPRMSVGNSISEGVTAAGPRSRAALRQEVRRLLEVVGLDPEMARVRPASLSGGQCQRVAIARAIAARPALLIADEITAALDVSVQGAILNLIRDVQREIGFTMLFISHNLAVVRYISSTVAVMYGGEIVEVGEARRVTEAPTHQYTRALLDAVPRVGGQP